MRKKAGIPELVSLESGQVQGCDHFDKAATLPVDRTVEHASADDYDGLVLPGGVGNPDRLRTDENAVSFVRSFFEQSKPVAVICHGPWTLVEADVVRNRTLTSWPSLQTDIRNAGAKAERNSGSSGSPASSAARLSKRGEAEALIRGDPEPAMVARHALVPTQLLGVMRRAAEHLAPPGGDMRTVLLADPAGEEWREQLVAFDPVVQGVDQLPECNVTSGPLMQGGRVACGARVHHSNLNLPRRSKGYARRP